MAASPVTLDVPWLRLQATFTAFPKNAFFHLAGAMYGTFKSHRDAFLAKTDVDIDSHGGKGLRVQNITARKVGKPGGFAGVRSFFFSVTPKSWKWKPGQRLEDIEAESFTYSKAALGLEEGGTFTSKRSRFIALPIGAALRSDGKVIPRWSSPRKFQKGGKKETMTRPQHGHPGNRIIWWNRAASRSKKAAKRWVPVFLLVPKVTRKERLNYIETWDALESDRTRRFRAMLGNILHDVARTKP